MPMLASDLLNPDFVGARNPDESLHVEFYWKEVLDMHGNKVLDHNNQPLRVPYVMIAIPGNDTSVVRTPARESHKARFPRQWQYWQLQENPDNDDVPGFRLEDWEELTEDRKRELKYQRFVVLEQLANASDAQLQRVGPDGVALRIKARKALAERAAAASRKEQEERSREVTDLRQQLADLQAQIRALTTPPHSPPAGDQQSEAPAKRRGRPRVTA